MWNFIYTCAAFPDKAYYIKAESLYSQIRYMDTFCTELLVLMKIS